MESCIVILLFWYREGVREFVRDYGGVDGRVEGELRKCCIFDENF